MANINPTPGQAAGVKDDPLKPWKAVGSFVATVIVALYFELKGRETLEGMRLDEWFMVLLAALVVAITTFIIPNPKTTR